MPRVLTSQLRGCATGASDSELHESSVQAEFPRDVAVRYVVTLSRVHAWACALRRGGQSSSGRVVAAPARQLDKPSVITTPVHPILGGALSYEPSDPRFSPGARSDDLRGHQGRLPWLAFV